MTTAVLVPWQPGCPHREAAWRFVRSWWETRDFEVIEGSHGPLEGYSRSQAILDAASRCDADLLVIADADVFLAGDIAPALLAAHEHGWAVPHLLLHRLSPESTRDVYAGADWRGLPLSTDNSQDCRPNVGHEAGTLLVVRHDVLEQAPPDARFTMWGQEDDAWALALRCLIGLPWRGDADLVHLWHPPQPRLNRQIGSAANKALLDRYKAARRDPDRMRALIGEVTTCPTPST